MIRFIKRQIELNKAISNLERLSDRELDDIGLMRWQIRQYCKDSIK